MKRVFSRFTPKNILISLAVLIILVLVAEGIYWLQINKKLKKASEIEKPFSIEERYIEEPVEGLIEGNVVKLAGKVVEVEENLITLEVKEGRKQIALDEETTFFTTVEGANEAIEAGGPGVIEIGKEINVVYQRPKEGEVPIAISVLGIY